MTPRLQALFNGTILLLPTLIFRSLKNGPESWVTFPPPPPPPEFYRAWRSWQLVSIPKVMALSLLCVRISMSLLNP